MAVEKTRIITRYKSKFANAPISNTRIDALADRLAPTFADDATDDDIDASLDFQNSLYPFAEIAKNDDRERNEKAKAAAPKKPDAEPAKPNTPPAESQDDMPAWAKALLQSVQSAVQKVEGLETEAKQKSIRQQADDLLKDVPENFKKYAYATLPNDPEQLKDWAEGVKADHQAYDQKLRTDSLPGEGLFKRGNGSPGTQASKDEIAEITKNFKL